MRLLIATPLYPPDIGGPATFAAMAEGELPRQGIDVSLVLFRDVLHLPYGIRHLLFFLKVLKAGKKADAVLALDPLGVGLPTAFAARVLRKPFLLRVAGDRAWETYQTKIKNQKSKIKNVEEFQKERFGFSIELLRFLQRFVASRARAIIVPSNYFKTIITNWGIAHEKIHVVYSAFEESQMPDKESARRELGLTGTILISAGRLVPWKGFSMLIDLMPELSQRFPDLSLVIVGEGPERQKLEQEIHVRNLKNRVFLPGKLSQEKLFEYLAASDVFVLNTGYEGFSHQLLEVMALGLPVVTTAVGGNVEIIHDGEEGLLVGYNDRGSLFEAIVRLLSDSTLRQTLAQKARERLSEFGKEKSLTQLARLIKNICAS